MKVVRRSISEDDGVNKDAFGSLQGMNLAWGKVV